MASGRSQSHYSCTNVDLIGGCHGGTAQEGLPGHQRLHQGRAARHDRVVPSHERHDQGRGLPAHFEAPFSRYDLPAGVHPHAHLVRDGHDGHGRQRRVLRSWHHPAGRPRDHRGLGSGHGTFAGHHHGARRPSRGPGQPGQVFAGACHQRHVGLQPSHPGDGRPHDHDGAPAGRQAHRGLQDGVRGRLHPGVRLGDVHLLQDGHGLRAVRTRWPSDPARDFWPSARRTARLPAARWPSPTTARPP